MAGARPHVTACKLGRGTSLARWRLRSSRHQRIGSRTATSWDAKDGRAACSHNSPSGQLFHRPDEMRPGFVLHPSAQASHRAIPVKTSAGRAPQAAIPRPHRRRRTGSRCGGRRFAGPFFAGRARCADDVDAALPQAFGDARCCARRCSARTSAGEKLRFHRVLEERRGPASTWKRRRPDSPARRRRRHADNHASRSGPTALPRSQPLVIRGPGAGAKVTAARPCWTMRWRSCGRAQIEQSDRRHRRRSRPLARARRTMSTAPVSYSADLREIDAQRAQFTARSRSRRAFGDRALVQDVGDVGDRARHGRRRRVLESAPRSCRRSWKRSTSSERR